jgi:hypothetical protein
MAMSHSPLLVAGFNKAAKPPKKEKAKKGETSSHATQVGELAGEYKEPTPSMRIKKAAQDEKVHATRRWVSGEISDKQHTTAHRRANHAIKNAHKLGKHT